MVVLLLLFILSYNLYLQSTLTKVFDDVPGMENAQIEFDKAVIDIWDTYPEGQIMLHNVKVIDNADDHDAAIIFSTERLQVSFKNGAWSSKQLQLNMIQIDSGALTVRRDKDGHYNFEHLLSPKKEGDAETSSSRWDIDTDQLKLKINTTLLSYEDNKKGQSIITYLNKGDITLNRNLSKGVDIIADVDTKVLDFTFNEKNGSFLKNANLNGLFNININPNRINIDTTLLKINNETLSFAAHLTSIEDEHSYLYFKNDNTDFENIKLLLSPNLQTTLEPYEIDGIIQTEAWLTIMPSHPLRVDIDYRLPGNRLTINRQVFKDSKVSGHFVNDKYYDPNFGRVIRDKGYVRFDIDEASTSTQGADIYLNDALILSGPGHPVSIQSDAKISGPTQLISRELDNDHFLFQNGRFDLDSKVTGRLNSIQNIIQNSDLSMMIYDSDVSYLPSDVVLPLQSVHLKKRANDASFSINGLTVDEEYNLFLDGTVSNFIGLLYDMNNSRAETHVDIVTKRMTWQDFIYILGQGSEGASPKSDDEQRKSMKQTMRGIQHHFQPDINIRIDSSGYYDLTSIEDISAHIYFPEKDIIAIDDTEFTLDNGQVNFDCRLDLSSDDVTPFDLNLKAIDVDLSELLPPFDYFGVSYLRDLNYLPRDFDIDMHLQGVINDSIGIIKESLSGDIVFNSTVERIEYARISFDFVESTDSIDNTITYPITTDIQIIGNPAVFNDYLDNDQFFFNNGLFDLKMDYVGENMSVSDVLKSSQIELTIDSSNVLYDPLSVTFPLTNIDLSINNDTATYNILMHSDSLNQEISLEGEVIHMSEILLESSGLQVKTTSQIYSPRIKWENFTDIFQIDTSLVLGRNLMETDKKSESKSSSKNNIVELIYQFYPDIIMQFDTIEYSDELAIFNFGSDISILDSVLYISDVDFDYGLGHIALSAEAALSEDDIESLQSNLKADNIDIPALLQDITLISKKAYPNLEYVSGILDLDMNMSHIAAADDQEQDPITTADIKFKIKDLEINDAPWMYAIGKKIRHSQRFRNVKFAPVENELFYSGDSIYIPLMELQSNAFDVFVEGHYHPTEPNIWLSLPIFNLKERDISIIPDKEGYARRKLKLHLEYAVDDQGDHKLKPRWTKRKFYKDRAKLDLWKANKKRYRKERRER